MIPLVSVRVQPAREALQETLGVLRFPCGLVLIQYNGLLRAAAGAVQPYILREGEKQAPQDLQALLDCGNRFRQIVMENMHVGKEGNAVFTAAMRQAKAEGIQPMLYSHPVGTFGHGAGPIIGLYTNQGLVPGTGERTIEEDTCFALELNVYDNISCWDGQRVFMYLEENICRAAENDYIDGHQTKLLLI